MADPRILCAKVSFGVLAILFVTLWTIYLCYRYFIDEDWSFVTYKLFHEDTDSVYPSISICLDDNTGDKTLPIFNKEFLSDEWNNTGENGNETVLRYRNFLKGECIEYNDTKCEWNKSFYQINYDSVTLNIEDFILGFSMFLKNGTKYWLDMKTNDASKFSFFWPPKSYISKREAHQKCLTFDIPYIANSPIQSFSILYDISFLGEYPLRPSLDGFSLKLHYPQQMFYANVEQSKWEVKELSLESKGCQSSSYSQNNEKECHTSYTLNLIIQQLEATTRRNKKEMECIADWKNYDKEVKMILAKNMKCIPSHWNTSINLPRCREKKELRQAYLYNHYNTIVPFIDPPCKSIKSVIYTKDSYHGLTTFSNSKYHELPNNYGLGLMNHSVSKNVSEILLEFQVSNLIFPY